MHSLAFIHHINIAVRLKILFPFHNGGQIGGGIKRSPVRLTDQAGRNLLGVRIPGHIHYQSTLALMGQPLIQQHLNHVPDVGFRVAFTLPQIEFHVQVRVIFLKISHRNSHDMLPYCPEWGISSLKLQSRLMSPLLKHLIRLGLGAGRRIYLLQLADGKGRLLGKWPHKGFVKIHQLRLPVPEFLNDKAHLQSPVPQVHITNHMVAQETAHTLYALPDNSRPQMTHMERLCHVGPAVIHDNSLRLLRCFQSQLICPGHGTRILCQKLLGQFQVDETRHHSHCLGKNRVGAAGDQMFHHLVRYINGLLLICLSRCHGTVALVLTQVGTVG